MDFSVKFYGKVFTGIYKFIAFLILVLIYILIMVINEGTLPIW